MAELQAELCLEILSRSPVFQPATSSELERLAPRCTCERYRRGAEILRKGTVGDCLGVLGRGRVKGTLPSPEADGEFLVQMFWPGDVFGEVVIFDRQPRAGSAVAVTEAEIVFVPRVDVLALIDRRPAVALGLLEGLCDKLRVALDLSLAMRFLDIPSRLYRRLGYLCRYDSRLEGGGVRIQHGLSQKELADSIGASREGLNKVFGEWKRAGLLDHGRGFVVVHDPAALAMRLPAAVRQGPLIAATGATPAEVTASPSRRSRVTC
ncbi:MAG: Crp/Fnr family transcriptional regulator [Candidatus Binatia bacterium]